MAQAKFLSTALHNFLPTLKLDNVKNNNLMAVKNENAKPTTSHDRLHPTVCISARYVMLLFLS